MRRLRDWASRSVLNRLTAISTGVTVLLLGAVALIAFPLFYGQAQSNIAAHYRNNVERADEQLRFRTAALLEGMDELAANSFVVNAFVDSTGRELYLQPTLRDYRPPFGITQSLRLLDSNLSIFGHSGPALPLAPIEATIARSALDSGKTQLLFKDVQGRQRLFIAIPVYYPPASAHEGVLSSSVDARELMQPVLDTLKPTECLTVSVDAQPLLSTPCNAMSIGNRLSVSSAIAGGAEGDTSVTVTFADTSESPLRALSLIAAVYGVASMIALLLVFVATRTIGRPFAAKLEELARTAHALAAEPNSTARVRWDHDDEIGRLTLAFDTLVEKWRDIQSSLEQRVAQRTDQLAGALEQAQQSSRAKSEFLAVMSHEIRTPMNGVVGMIQALETTDLNDTQRRQLQVIRGSSDLLLRIIDDLLDFSRIEAGKLALDPAPLQVDHVVQDLMAALLPAAAAKGIALVLQPMAPQLSQTVNGDATRLRQVLTNLVHNAIKFTKPGGTVHVAVAAQPRADAIEFEFVVDDTGIGIDATHLRRIFDPFEQADRSTTRRFGGTGLGLAIVKRLVNLMGGSIDVRSEPGRGTTFTVRLALPTAAPAALAAGYSGRHPSFTRLRVLMAEDNPTNQLVATAQLNTLGIDQVTIAENGREVVAAAVEERFDLILMDIHMPDVDGFEATTALRRAGVITPIIAMTANVMPQDRSAYLDAGMVDYLAKPMDRERLRELIEQHCPSDPVAAAG
jgi:signal transduction histidine kinase/ActR/RegA family two-component response regulator